MVMVWLAPDHLKFVRQQAQRQWCFEQGSGQQKRRRERLRYTLCFKYVEIWLEEEVV